MINLGAKYHLTGLLVLTFGLCFHNQSLSQSPTEAFQLGGSGIESLSQLHILPEGDRLISGVFDEAFDVGDNTLGNVGENDVFLASLAVDETVNWALSFGSDFDDEVTGIALDGNQFIFAVGSFWLEMQLGSFDLQSTQSPKSIYLTKIDASTGTVQWAKTVEGSDVKVSTDLEFSNEGGLVLSGYFSDTLFLEDTTLTAQSETDFFLANFDSAGGLLWAVNYGFSGVNKALEVEILSNENIVLGGTFNDTLIIAGTTLIAETFDEDVFIASFSPLGTPIWVSKAGGVFEENVIDIKKDDSDQIYVSGHFVGVMTLGDGTSIQSSTGWADLFVLKYTSDGQVIDAVRFGGDELQHNTGMDVTADQILLTGNFRGEMIIGDNTYDAVGQTAGYVLRLDHDLQPLSGWTLRSSTNNVFPTTIVSDLAGDFIVGGGFGDEINGVSGLQQPEGLFDIFLLTYPENTVNSIPELEILMDFKIFPNPVRDFLQIRTSEEIFQVELWDINGRLLLSQNSTRELDFSQFPGGSYFLIITLPSGKMVEKVVKH